MTSSPLLIGGVAYLGGGVGNWYALNATSGNSLWHVFTGSITTGHYNWSSPAALNGHAFVGVASLCDMPLVQGKLLRVNLATRQIVTTWKVVPDGQLGGTIWTKPVVDAARNTVYVTTGNRAYDSTGNSQQYTEALVAVDATTLAIKGFWSLPVSDPTPDADWGHGTHPVQGQPGARSGLGQSSPRSARALVGECVRRVRHVTVPCQADASGFRLASRGG